MSQNTFEVVFSGRLVEGAAPEQVKANVAALFKVEVAKVERLFSGATVAIKKGVDEATAKKYQLALHKAGALTQVVNRAAAPVAATTTPAQKPAASPAASAVSGDAPVDSVTAAGLQKSVVKAPPLGFGELAGAAVDVPGTTLIKHQEVPPPQIDTSDLQMDQVGVELVEHQEVEPPQVDTSALSMGAAGETIVDEEPVAPLEVDLSDMTLDEPGVTLVEHEDEPPPQIDTSKLSLD